MSIEGGWADGGPAANGEMGLNEYLSQFVNENPELLPARIAGGSGMETAHRPTAKDGGIDMDKIRPGMSPEELERVGRKFHD